MFTQEQAATMYTALTGMTIWSGKGEPCANVAREIIAKIDAMATKVAPVSVRGDLTDRQQQMLDFIRDYRIQHGYSPSIRDIGIGLLIKSPNGVMCHIKALTKKGYLRHDPLISRSIVLV